MASMANDTTTVTGTITLAFIRRAARVISASVLVALITPCVYANPLDGRLTVSKGFLGTSSRLTGDIDRTAGTLHLNPAAIYGVTGTFIVSELLGPGTYTRSYDLAGGGTINRTGTIPSGKIGAYFVIAHNGYEYQVFNAWTVSADGLNYSVYNIPSDVLLGGALDGVSLVTSFSIPADSLELSVNVEGGLDLECSETGGTTITANATTTGGLALDRVEWKVDGQYQGDGLSKSFFIPLGGATIEATAYATDGVTVDSKTLSVNVTDTMAPTLDILFIDGNGNEATTAQAGDYTIKLNVSDVCDPTPSANGSAKPVMQVFDGDIITINSPNDVRLPTTAVDVTAEAIDTSGNKTVAMKVLNIQ